MAAARPTAPATLGVPASNRYGGSAHVDFWSLAQAARGFGAEVQGPVTQGDFLIRLGARERADRLLQIANPTQAASIRDGLDRLIHPSRMRDHTDAELILLESLVGREPPFKGIPGLEY